MLASCGHCKHFDPKPDRGGICTRTPAKMLVDDGYTCNFFKVAPMGDIEARMQALSNNAAPAVAPANWQPAKTAPKDGTTFIGRFEGALRPKLIRYQTEDGDFVNRFVSAEMCVPIYRNMTHWMPLPELPKEDV